MESQQSTPQQEGHGRFVSFCLAKTFLSSFRYTRSNGQIREKEEEEEKTYCLLILRQRVIEPDLLHVRSPSSHQQIRLSILLCHLPLPTDVQSPAAVWQVANCWSEWMGEWTNHEVELLI